MLLGSPAACTKEKAADSLAPEEAALVKTLGFDEAVFKKTPADMDAFAREVYEFCPDVVDQGVGTVHALAREMRKTGALYLWWD